VPSSYVVDRSGMVGEAVDLIRCHTVQATDRGGDLRGIPALESGSYQRTAEPKSAAGRRTASKTEDCAQIASATRRLLRAISDL